MGISQATFYVWKKKVREYGDRTKISAAKLLVRAS